MRDFSVKLSREDRKKLRAIRSGAAERSKPKRVPGSTGMGGPGSAKPAVREDDREKAVNAYVAAHGKSVFMAFVVVLLFGPLGYLYVGTLSGLVAVLLAIGAYSVLGPPGVVFAWLVCVFAAPFEASSNNDKLRATAKLMAMREK